jgi:hypothetical protein
MEAHRRDFFAKNGFTINSSSGDDNYSFQFARGFNVFGLQQIPDPYGLPMPRMSRYVSVSIPASSNTAINSSKENKQKVQEGKEKVRDTSSKDSVSDKKDNKEKTVEKHNGDKTEDKNKSDKSDKKEKDRIAVA